jgi:manganese transport protein
VRSDVSDVLSAAEDSVAAARIAARRFDRVGLAKAAHDRPGGRRPGCGREVAVMKKIFSIALGILTAIVGFVDGDLVTNALVGSRFGLSLVWVVAVGVLGICVFAEISGRIAAISRRATFDLIRERLGPRVGLLALAGSMAVTLLTFIVEIGGVARALELATSVNEFLWVPLAGAAVWLVLWRTKFSLMENVFGLLGIGRLGVAVWLLGPDYGDLWQQASHPAKPAGEASRRTCNARWRCSARP